VLKKELKPAVTADPLGDLANARSAASPNEPFVYFVQVGAFRTAEDAESQRAKLSLSGVEAKVSEREQSGRAVFRVRVGPFDKKEEAEKSKEKLTVSGLETALVRVQR
jgi:cell division protein FtsN